MMPRINSALFNFKPGTRDKKKHQRVFDLDPFGPRFVPIVPPELVDIAEKIMDGSWDDTSFDPEDLS